MTGKPSRDKGNRFEVALTHYLTDKIGRQVITSRNGRGGAQGGADLHAADDDGRFRPHVNGWTLEAKDVAGTSVPSWLGQARIAADDAGVDWWAVVHKQRHKTVDDARVFLPRLLLRDYLVVGEPDPEGYLVGDHVHMTLGAFVEVCL